MKPINLKIKGLNSFEEEQEIDFVELTKRGFFGIFGPTGSGKSTILDGITIALYGDESRNSADFINVNCEDTQVSFEFQISGQETKRYLVQREYRRDKHTQKPRTYKCRIMDITGDEPVVLEESVTGVNNKCREIIGLTKEDFTRTVVLPQGKFSEFLKMEGKSRRDMLERLFNLYEYGENLKQKLKSRMDREITTKVSIEGEIKGIGDVNSEDLDGKIENLTSVKNEIEKETEAYRYISIKHEENREVYQLQTDLEVHRKEQEELEKSREAYDKKGEVLESNKAANALYPYIEEYEILNKDKGEKKDIFEKSSERYEEAKTKKEKARSSHDLAKEDYETVLPGMLIQAQRVADALLEQKELEDLTSDADSLRLEIERLKNNVDEKSLKRVSLREKLASVEAIMLEIAENMDAVKVDSHRKEITRDGEKLTTEVEGFRIIIEKIKDKIAKNEKLLQDFEAEKASILDKKVEMEALLESLNGKKAKLEKDCPGTLEELAAYQLRISEHKSKWEKHESLSGSIKDARAEKEILEKEIINLKEAVSLLSDEGLELDKAIENIQNENMAHILRDSLMEGMPCPVCGSMDHHPEKMSKGDIESLEKIKEEKAQKELLLKKSENDLNERKLRTGILKENIDKFEKELFSLGSDFLNLTVVEGEAKLTLMNKKINEYDGEKKGLDESLNNSLREQTKIEGLLNTANANVENIRKQLKENLEDLDINQNEFEEKTVRLTELKKEYNIDNFIQMSEEIKEKDKKREKLEIKREEVDKNKKGFSEEIEKLSIEISELTGILVEKRTEYKSKEKNIKKLKKSIGDKTGYVKDIRALKSELDAKMSAIERNYKEQEILKEKLAEEYEHAKNNYLSAMQSIREVEKRFAALDKSLGEKIIESRFVDLSEAKAYLLSIEDIRRIEKEIESYRDALSRAGGAVESLERKLLGREISEEEWNKLKATKVEKEVLLEGLKEERALLEKEIEDIKGKISELKKLKGIIKEIEQRMAILKDLEGLFKGNRFVEYVATERLKYVSREASVRLTEITGGSYGLETDDEGRFLIKDNKNGGVLRESSTLSGGETFLASLALALALSAEIQLKGTAPLELFFLDEGFGSLDENLLDVVMTSLERIHHEKLKVGIISHIESVKNRVPVKLIVTEAVTGEGGSRVSIDMN